MKINNVARLFSSESWNFSIDKSLFVRIMIFIENLDLSYFSIGIWKYLDHNVPGR